MFLLALGTWAVVVVVGVVGCASEVCVVVSTPQSLKCPPMLALFTNKCHAENARFRFIDYNDLLLMALVVHELEPTDSIQ